MNIFGGEHFMSYAIRLTRGCTNKYSFVVRLPLTESTSLFYMTPKKLYKTYFISQALFHKLNMFDIDEKGTVFRCRLGLKSPLFPFQKRHFNFTPWLQKKLLAKMDVYIGNVCLGRCIIRTASITYTGWQAVVDIS